jgi:hypothetical protein
MLRQIYESRDEDVLDRFLSDADDNQVKLIWLINAETPPTITLQAYTRVTRYLERRGALAALSSFHMRYRVIVAPEVNQLFQELVYPFANLDAVYEAVYSITAIYSKPELTEYLLDNITFTDRWIEFLKLFVPHSDRLNQLALGLLTTNREDGVYLFQHTNANVNVIPPQLALELCLDTNVSVVQVGKFIPALAKFPDAARIDAVFQIATMRRLEAINNRFVFDLLRTVPLPMDRTRVLLRHLVNTNQPTVITALLRNNNGVHLPRRTDELVKLMETVENTRLVDQSIWNLNAPRRSVRMPPRLVQILLKKTGLGLPLLSNITGMDVDEIKGIRAMTGVQLLLLPRAKKTTRDVVTLVSRALVEAQVREVDEPVW